MKNICLHTVATGDQKKKKETAKSRKSICDGFCRMLTGHTSANKHELQTSSHRLAFLPKFTKIVFSHTQKGNKIFCKRGSGKKTSKLQSIH